MNGKPDEIGIYDGDDPRRTRIILSDDSIDATTTREAPLQLPKASTDSAPKSPTKTQPIPIISLETVVAPAPNNPRKTQPIPIYSPDPRSTQDIPGLAPKQAAPPIPEGTTAFEIIESISQMPAEKRRHVLQKPYDQLTAIVSKLEAETKLVIGTVIPRGQNFDVRNLSPATIERTLLASGYKIYLQESLADDTTQPDSISTLTTSPNFRELYLTLSKKITALQFYDTKPMNLALVPRITDEELNNLNAEVVSAVIKQNSHLTVKDYLAATYLRAGGKIWYKPHDENISLPINTKKED